VVDVVTTDEFAGWYEELPVADASAVDRVVGLLEARGIALGHPYSSELFGSCAFSQAAVPSESFMRLIRGATRC
jgi:hypothetical protein